MLNIPKEIYVGFSPPKNDKLAFSAELCPNDTARKKRKESLKYRYKQVEIYENKPLPGFTLTKNETAWYGQKDYWRVIDPRGFKHNIDANNASNIIQCTGITKGLIHERCVWGYNAGRIILLPQNSKPYLDAFANTEVLSARVYLRDVQLGDIVQLQNKLVGQYLGPQTFKVAGKNPWNSVTIGYGSEGKGYFFKILENGVPLGYHVSKTIKISNIVTKAEEPLDKEAIRQELNENKLGSRVNNNYQSCMDRKGKKITSTGDVPGYYLKDKKEKVGIELQEVGFIKFIEQFDFERGRYSSPQLCYAEYDNEIYNLSQPRSSYQNNANAITLATVVEGTLVDRIDYDECSVHLKTRKPKEKQFSSYKRYGSAKAVVEAKFQLQECEKYYIIRYVTKP